jgi:hypothetical protein
LQSGRRRSVDRACYVNIATAITWILWVARRFPVRHFAVGLQAAFLGMDRRRRGRRMGVAGLLLASRYFSWEPHR